MREWMGEPTPEPRPPRALTALLPDAIARDAFEPAWHDLRNARVAGRVDAPP